MSMDEGFLQPWECEKNAEEAFFSHNVLHLPAGKAGKTRNETALCFGVAPRGNYNPAVNVRKLVALSTVILFTLFSILPPQAYAEVITLDGGTIDIQKQDNITNWNVTGNPVWNVPEFNVTEGATHNITGLSAGASLAVLVNGGNASNIFGTMNLSNLDFILQNIAGINIGSSANINLNNAALIASTLPLNLDVTNFLSRQYAFEGQGGFLRNDGTITGGKGDVVALVANSIRNTGTIEVPMGTVALAAGDVVTVGISADGMVTIGVDEATVNALGLGVTKDQIKNTGKIQANGGRVILDAKAIDTLFDRAINIDASENATAAIVADDGLIEFIAEGDIKNTGTLQAKRGSIEIDATGDVENEGTIETLSLHEHGYTFRSTGVLKGGDVYMNNTDGAGYLSGTLGSNVTDAGEIIVNGDITLSDSITITAGTAFTMGQGYTITGGGKNLTISSSGSSTIGKVTGVNDLILSQNGSAVTYQVQNAVTLIGDLTVNTGVTLTGGHSVTVGGGSVTGDGTINMTGGTFTVLGPGGDSAGQFGGNTPWTFWNLFFGDGTTAGVTQKAGPNKVTILTELKISLGHELKAGSSTWDLSWGGGYFTDAIQVAAGEGFTVAVRTDGTVWSWGNTQYGRLGNGVNAPGSTDLPVQVLGVDGSGFLSGVKSIVAGCAHVIALLTNGNVVGWGRNNYGQVGDGTETDRTFPVTLTALTGKNIISISVGPSEAGGSSITSGLGGNHSLALSADGKVYSWGNNSYGQLGRSGNRDIPTAISGLSSVTAIAAGSYNSLFLLGDGTVYGSGYNGYAQMANSTYYSWTNPLLVVGTLEGGLTVTGIAAGTYHTLYLLSDGTVAAMGRDNRGQLGNDATLSSSSSLVTVAGLTGVTSIAAGGAHSLALLTDGTVYSWGYNPYGQLGNGTRTDSPLPVAVSGLSGVLQLAAGQGHSTAVLNDGTLVSWGNILGNNSASRSVIPVHAVLDFGELLNLTDIGQISAGYQFTLALKSDGSKVYAWGTNTYGQLGNGSVANSNTPVLVRDSAGDGYLTGVASIAAGQFYALALMKDGTVMSWGRNNTGQLGIGDSSISSRLLPGLVPGLTGAVEISAGGSHILVRLENALVGDISDDTLVAWGGNTYGQLGLGHNDGPQYAPVAVPGLVGVAEISAGYQHSLARMSNGTSATDDDTLMAWGYNLGGELGVGDYTNRNIPSQVCGLGGIGFLTGVQAISAGTSHSLALLPGGIVYAWGKNQGGELGNGVSFETAITGGASSPIPVLVSGLEGSLVTDIAAGQSFSLALLSDGTLKEWGTVYTSSTSQAFLSTAADKSGISGVIRISGVWGHNSAVLADGTVMSWGANSGGCLGDNSTNTSAQPVYSVIPAYAPFTVDGTFTPEDSTFEYSGDYAFGKVAVTLVTDTLYNRLIVPQDAYKKIDPVLAGGLSGGKPLRDDDLDRIAPGGWKREKRGLSKLDLDEANRQLDENVKYAARHGEEGAEKSVERLLRDTVESFFEPMNILRFKTSTSVFVNQGAVFVLDVANEVSFLEEGSGLRVDFKRPVPNPAEDEGKAGEFVKKNTGLMVATPVFRHNPGEAAVVNPPSQPGRVGPTGDNPAEIQVHRAELKDPGRDVFIRSPGGQWQPATTGTVLLPGDEVRTITGSSVKMLLEGGAVGQVEVSERSFLRIGKAETNTVTGDKTTLLELAVGKVLVHAEKLKGESSFEVRTPTALTGVRGTTFTVEVKEKE